MYSAILPKRMNGENMIYLFIYVIKKVYGEINLVNQIDIDWEIEFVNETDSSKF